MKNPEQIMFDKGVIFIRGGGGVYYFRSTSIKIRMDLDQIQMESDPFGSDPLFEGRLHGIGSRTVGVYTGSDPCRFYELLAAL